MWPVCHWQDLLKSIYEGHQQPDTRMPPGHLGHLGAGVQREWWGRGYGRPSKWDPWEICSRFIFVFLAGHFSPVRCRVSRPLTSCKATEGSIKSRCCGGCKNLVRSENICEPWLCSSSIHLRWCEQNNILHPEFVKATLDQHRITCFSFGHPEKRFEYNCRFKRMAGRKS